MIKNKLNVVYEMLFKSSLTTYYYDYEQIKKKLKNYYVIVNEDYEEVNIDNVNLMKSYTLILKPHYKHYKQLKNIKKKEIYFNELINKEFNNELRMVTKYVSFDYEKANILNDKLSLDEQWLEMF